MTSRQARAIVLDLDTAVIDRRRAWQYAVEEAVLSVTGERATAAALVDEYHTRSFGDAVSILVRDPALRERCANVADQFFRRSALKRLLVFDGIGMALDRMRGERVEIGGITREPHRDALRQIESTGVDRFLTVLSPTNTGPWNPVERFQECIAYMGRLPGDTVFFSAVARDVELVATAGATSTLAAWTAPAAAGGAVAQLATIRSAGIA